jgi:hypothetical protein
MIAAMMLPSALPAIARRVRDRDRDRMLAAPLFAGSDAGIWPIALVALALI